MRVLVPLLALLLLGCPGTTPSRSASLQIEPPAVELGLQEREALPSTMQFQARSLDPVDTVEWSSTRPEVATVDASGLVTAVAAGTTFIVATGSHSHASANAGVLVHGERRYDEISWARDIEPMFRTAGFWYPRSAPCVGCHFGTVIQSAAEMDLTTWAGLRRGSYTLTQAPGFSIVGERNNPASFEMTDAAVAERTQLQTLLATETDPAARARLQRQLDELIPWWRWFAWTNMSPGAGPPVWDDYARLKWRLTNYRMPVGQYHWLDGTHREGPAVTIASTRSAGTPVTVNAIQLLQAWIGQPVTGTDGLKHLAGPTAGESFGIPDERSAVRATFTDDVLPLFTTPSLWYDRAQNCSYCHFANFARTAREMSLLDYPGINAGAMSLSNPPGHSILGERRIGARNFNWDHAYLGMRLQNERMPPGWPFDRNSTTLGPTVSHPVTGRPILAIDLIGEWVSAGAPDN